MFQIQCLVFLLNFFYYFLSWDFFFYVIEEEIKVYVIYSQEEVVLVEEFRFV